MDHEQAFDAAGQELERVAHVQARLLLARNSRKLNGLDGDVVSQFIIKNRTMLKYGVDRLLMLIPASPGDGTARDALLSTLLPALLGHILEQSARTHCANCAPYCGQPLPHALGYRMWRTACEVATSLYPENVEFYQQVSAGLLSQRVAHFPMVANFVTHQLYDASDGLETAVKMRLAMAMAVAVVGWSLSESRQQWLVVGLLAVFLASTYVRTVA